VDSDLATSAVAKPKPVTVSVVQLSVVVGPDRGKTAQISGVARVGTASGTQLALTDPKVSRLHLELRTERHGCRVIDLGSTNGTSLDGVVIHDAELRSGSTLQLGDTSLRVDFGGETCDLPLSESDHFGSLLGRSSEMRIAYALLERAAGSDATVLLSGETGTGKELAARALHRASPRAAGPYVVVDCASLAESVIESELFGHKRGAFTGAEQTRIGLFEAADGGTLFLDEIDSLPPTLQPRLLRVLESQELRRVGENEARPIDVRVIAATGTSLAERVNSGMFREDLWYRLAVVEVVLPPLRTRGADIALLARHFWTTYAPNTEFPEHALPSLFERTWSGNVRELRNAIQRLAVVGSLAPERTLGGDQSGDDWKELLTLPLHEARRRSTELFEQRYAAAMLENADGNVTRAAELAGVNRRTFQRLIERQPPSKR
jgi:transcriptional regulator with GAF, ATPase, and Fis domain